MDHRSNGWSKMMCPLDRCPNGRSKCISHRWSNEPLSICGCLSFKNVDGPKYVIRTEEPSQNVLFFGDHLKGKRQNVTLWPGGEGRKKWENPSYTNKMKLK